MFLDWGAFLLLSFVSRVCSLWIGLMSKGVLTIVSERQLKTICEWLQKARLAAKLQAFIHW